MPQIASVSVPVVEIDQDKEVVTAPVVEAPVTPQATVELPLVNPNASFMEVHGAVGTAAVEKPMVKSIYEEVSAKSDEYGVSYETHTWAEENLSINGQLIDHVGSK